MESKEERSPFKEPNHQPQAIIMESNLRILSLDGNSTNGYVKYIKNGIYSYSGTTCYNPDNMLT